MTHFLRHQAQQLIFFLWLLSKIICDHTVVHTDRTANVMQLYVISAIALAVVYHPPATVAQSWSCATENYEYAPNKWDEFCVFRAITWRKGAPEPDISGEPTQTRVAVLESKLPSLPGSLYDKFPQLAVLVVRNTTLEVLTVKNRLESVYAEQNMIKSLRVEGTAGAKLKQLHLRDNPINDLRNVSERLTALEVLDLSKTAITENVENVVDFQWFAAMVNLTELYLAHVDAYYIENVAHKTLPNVRLLDLSGNLITPSNFQLDVFRALPALEELDLRNAMMSDFVVSVADIRKNLPALQRIYLEGNDLKCELLKSLVNHLKENRIEVPGSPGRCNLGYEKHEGLCCKTTYNPFIPPVTTKPPTTERPAKETTMKPTMPDGPDTRDQVPVEPVVEHNIGVWIACIVMAIIAIAAVAVLFVVRHLKQRQPVPTEEAHDL